jgi:hypothetical protein
LCSVRPKGCLAIMIVSFVNEKPVEI